jgi:hypothetical protein
MEALRTYRERVGSTSAEFDPISPVFRHLELTRMLLAKHEPKGKRGLAFYPLLLVQPDKGWVGWKLFDPETEEPLNVFRRHLADEFLETMETAA